MTDLKNELDMIVSEIKTQGEMRCVNGATEEEIESFENKYNVKLPLKFKIWLSFCDGGELFVPAGVQLYGVAHNPLIDVDDSDRPSDNYIVIGALASGDPILCQKNSEQISIYNHEAGKIEEDEVYLDFFDFLKDLYNALGIGD